MHVVDYILGNNDRHVENWGLFLHNNGKMGSLHPLMDFDHAFFNGKIYAQTTEHDSDLLEDVAKEAILRVPEIILGRLLGMQKPEILSAEE